MKKILFTILLLFAVATTGAQTVGTDEARKAARQFMALHESPGIADDIAQVPYRQYADGNGDVVMNVFNIGDYGFIITGADRSFTPIVGYSFNGAFDTSRIPDNLGWWLDSYVDDVAAVKKSSAKSTEIIAAQRNFRDEWDALERGGSSFYDAKGPDAVEALVETRWDQGTGYNNYCPEYNGGHSVTGCVATAMAQIIRYHRFPSTGYYHRQYVHSVYGSLRADFDSAHYDYSLMPNSVSGYSNSAQQHAVSQLCYHCGVAVKMNYQSYLHTDGSGAHSQDVPEAFQFFGYTNSFYLDKNSNSTIWDSLLRHDLDAGRPVYYSGSNSDGGHAFVCDGYRNNGRYHFNFGWSGYGDGFYSLTSVNGYSSAQAAVFNIVPCNMGPWHDTLYVADDGTGDGSSWSSAYPDLESAMAIANLYSTGQIWIKNGTYYGNTSSDIAFTMPKGVTLYGGFAGTESDISERDLHSGATVLSGNNQRAVLLSPVTTTSGNIYDITFADGIATNGAVVNVKNSIRLERCVFENNQVSDPENDAIAYLTQTNIYCSIFRNNNGSALKINNGQVRNSLIAHNNGNGIIASNSTVDGSDVVCNSGVGIVNNNTKIRNCVIWRNDSSLSNNNIQRITFSAIEGFGEKDSNSNFGISHINRPNEGIGPFFVAPDTTIGPVAEIGDWRLSSLSPLVNAGDTIRTGSYVIDLAGDNRFRSGRADIGCYEQDPYVGIETPADDAKVRIYPNPATDIIWVETAEPTTVEILDIMGRRIISAKASVGRTQLDVNALPQGIYIIRTENATSKFIKK